MCHDSITEILAIKDFSASRVEVAEERIDMEIKPNA
jgi:hypothetical protein